MSNWITDRKPTEEDCKGVLGTPYESQVWVNVLDTVETFDFFHVKTGVAWHPIVIEKPEPYVAPKPPRFIPVINVYDKGSWAVVDEKRYFADGIPTREAAERIAAIYNEVMK